MARNGRDVEQLRESSGESGEKRPDFKIDGEPYDNYAPRTGNARNIGSVVNEKVATEQAKRIVLNPDDSKATNEAVIKQFQDHPVDGLEDLVIVRDGKVTQVPLKKGP